MGIILMRYFKSAMVDRNEYTKTYLDNIMKYWNTPLVERKTVMQFLKTKACIEDGNKKYYSDEVMWDAINESPYMKKVVTNRGLKDYPSFIADAVRYM